MAADQGVTVPHWGSRHRRERRPGSDSRLVRLRRIEVTNLGRRERLAKHGHAVFPRPLADEGQALDVGKVLDVELDVFPERACTPAVEIVHFAKDADLAVLLDQPFHLRDKASIVVLGELAAQLDDQDLATCFFLQIDRHDQPPPKSGRS